MKLDLTVMDDPALVDKVFTEFDFDAFVWVWTSPPNPTFMLSVESNTTFGVLSDVYYSNPEYEKLYQAQTVETDFKKRQALVHQAQQIFYDDAAYAVLYYPSVLLANRTDKLTGWLPIPGGYVQNFTTANYLSLDRCRSRSHAPARRPTPSAGSQRSIECPAPVISEDRPLAAP